MFRCDICAGVSQPGERRKTFQVRGPAPRELSICGGCAFELAAGTSLDALMARHAERRAATRKGVAPPYVPGPPRDGGPMPERRAELSIGPPPPPPVVAQRVLLGRQPNEVNTFKEQRRGATS